MRMKSSISLLAGCVALVWPFPALPCTIVVSPIEVGSQFQVSVTDRGRPVRGLRVVLSPAVFPQDDKDAGKIYSTTNSEGIAQFSDLSPGSLYVSAQYDGGESFGVVIDISPSSHLGTTVAMTWPSRSPMMVRSASGIIRNPGFYPSLDQNPFSLGLIEGFSGRVLDTTTSDRKGRFSFTGDFPPGIYYIRLNPSGIRAWDGEQIQGTIPIEVNSAEGQDTLDLDLGWTSCGLSYARKVSEPGLKVNKICGDINDTEGAVVSKAQVFLLAESDEAEVIEQTKSGRMGEFALEERNEGMYQLIVKSPGFRPSLRAIRLEAANSPGVCQQPIHVILGIL